MINPPFNAHTFKNIHPWSVVNDKSFATDVESLAHELSRYPKLIRFVLPHYRFTKSEFFTLTIRFMHAPEDGMWWIAIGTDTTQEQLDALCDSDYALTDVK